MSDAFFRANPDAWPIVVDAYAASHKQWAEEVVLCDLRWWWDRVRRGEVGRIPGRPTLARRWGWTDYAVKQVLRAEEGWKPPADRQNVASGPPEHRQNTARPRKVETGESPTERQNTASGPPADRQNIATRALETETETETEQKNTPPPPSPGGAALPTWAQKIRPAPGQTRPQVMAAVVRAKGAITGRLEDPGRCATASKPLLSLWRALERPDPDRWADEMQLVAEAARDCHEQLFARDIRAEGWPDGVNRVTSVPTLCRHDRWDDRLRAAEAHAEGRCACIRGSPAKASPGTYIPPADWDEQKQIDEDRYWLEAQTS